MQNLLNPFPEREHDNYHIDSSGDGEERLIKVVDILADDEIVFLELKVVVIELWEKDVLVASEKGLPPEE